MLITLIILVLSAAFFVAGKVRSDIVALCALIGLLIFQILLLKRPFPASPTRW